MTIANLQSDAGKKLNGKIGKVLTEELNEDGRHQVQVEGIQKVKLMKPANIETIADKDLVQVYRIPCDGEGERHQVLLFPKQHSMFQNSRKNLRGNAPAMALCGLPLVVKKTTPRKRLGDRADYDNQWATWLMIEPNSGFAPAEWQSGVGPVLVYRPSGKIFSADDMDATNEFLSSLLDAYGDGPEFNPRTWINPDFFRNFVQQLRAGREVSNVGSALKGLTLMGPDALDLTIASELAPLLWRR